MLSKKWAKLAGGSEDVQKMDSASCARWVTTSKSSLGYFQAETQRLAWCWRVSKHSAYFQFSSVQFSSVQDMAPLITNPETAHTPRTDNMHTAARSLHVRFTIPRRFTIARLMRLARALRYVAFFPKARAQLPSFQKSHLGGADALCFPNLLSKYLQFALLLLGVETAQLPATIQLSLIMILRRHMFRSLMMW